MKMESSSSSTLLCSVVGIDHSKNISYRVCSTCERTLQEEEDHTNNTCKYCTLSNANYPRPPPSSSSSKRLFRILMSIATDTKVFVVIMFDRAAKVLFGCSADDFFDFAKRHPFAAENAAKVLEGEMLQVTLSKPKNGNAQHQRVASVVPLRSGFQPVIQELRDMYKVSTLGS